MKPLLLLLALAGAAFLCLTVGERPITLTDLPDALLWPDPDNPAHLVIRDYRLPRLWAGLIAGAGLAAAGVLMQAATRNPLAEAGILGVNAGAGLALVAGSTLLPGVPAALLAFPGAALAMAAVFLLGGGARGAAGPVRLALAGVALNALLMSVVMALVLIRPEALEIYRFWIIGSLAEAGSRPLGPMAAVVLAGLALALLLAPALDALALGEDAAQALGTRVALVRGGTLLAVTLLCGAAVAVAGPVAFLGLAVPHLLRPLVGPGCRALLTLAVLAGPALLLLADVAGRVVLPPGEVRVGTMTALLGGVMFTLIARRLRPGAAA